MRLIDKNDVQLGQNLECCVCMTNPPDTLFWDCGHGGICWDCG